MEMERSSDSSKQKDAVGHVHFADGVEAHNLIQVKPEGDDKVHVHVGFLQTNHKYEIKFDVPNLVGSDVSAEQTTATNASTKVDMAIVDVKPTDSTNANLHIVVHLSLVKEGLLRHSFTLKDKEYKELVVVIHARVLGRHTGTPMLKDGIHCLAVTKDGESDKEFTGV